MVERVVRFGLLILPVLFSACGDDDNDDAGLPALESVEAWHCCAGSSAAGDSCECVELTPGEARACSGQVDTCSEGDGEYGCCAAFHDGEGWQCECYPAGTDCSGLSGADGLQTVTSCPP